MTKVVVVDKHDEPIGLKSYDELSSEDIYRVSALWLIDSKTGDCLITQRNWAKHNDPGKWMSAVSGTIEEGEGYDENIVHEIEEEIGLTNLKLKKGPKMSPGSDRKHKYFTQWYFAEVDRDQVTITIQKEEVETYKWVPIKKLVEEVVSNPGKFVPTMKDSLKLLGVSQFQSR